MWWNKVSEGMLIPASCYCDLGVNFLYKVVNKIEIRGKSEKV